MKILFGRHLITVCSVMVRLRRKLYAEVIFVWVSDGIIWVWVAVGRLDIISDIIIYIPMYTICLPTYLRAYLPIMYTSLLY
jgi:hypothetical protein